MLTTPHATFFDAADLHLLKRIALEPGPDFGVYDDASRILYLGNGGKGARADFSYISLISVDRQEVIDRIPRRRSDPEGHGASTTRRTDST